MGWSAPAPMRERSSAARPVWASPFLVSVLASGGCRAASAGGGEDERSEDDAPRRGRTHRRRTTRCAHAVHERLAFRRCGGAASQAAGPNLARTTGSSVTATRTLTSGMSMPA